MHLCVTAVKCRETVRHTRNGMPRAYRSLTVILGVNSVNQRSSTRQLDCRDRSFLRYKSKQETFTPVDISVKMS